MIVEIIVGAVMLSFFTRAERSRPKGGALGKMYRIQRASVTAP